MEFYSIEGFSKYLLGKGEGDNEWSVWRIKKNGELKKVEGYADRSGHKRYSLHSDGKQVAKWLHQLIAEQFIPKPNELLESKEPLDVHHRDHNPRNNSISNLCWITHSEHISLHNKGNKHPMYGKHRAEGAGKPQKQVFQYDLEGNLVRVWSSTCECGRNGYLQGHISACCNGKRRTHKGYRWSYQPL